MCKTHRCYLCSKRDVFKSSGFDFSSWKIDFLYHAHDYDEDYSRNIAGLVPDNLKAIGVLWNHWNEIMHLKVLLYITTVSIWKVGDFEVPNFRLSTKYNTSQKPWIYCCFAYFLYTLLAGRCFCLSVIYVFFYSINYWFPIINV